jgi:hypothetical protein
MSNARQIFNAGTWDQLRVLMAAMDGFHRRDLKCGEGASWGGDGESGVRYYWLASVL